MPIRPLIPLMLMLLPAVAVAAERPPRYAAMLANGQRLEGAKLSDWHEEKSMPRLDGAPLMEPSNPLRWLRDRSQPLSDLPQAYVEFTNGDRLPGVVVDYKSGEESPFDPQPPHLIVRVAIQFEPPDNKRVNEVRVLAGLVRRIVWQRRGRPLYQPGTALFRDGRSLAFRAHRHRAGEAHLLLAEGDRRIDWSELAELHLPAADTWNSWFDHVAPVCTNADTRLLELETSTGLIATASTARWTPRFEGNSSEADRWAHGIQPAWSLDILWIPFREVAYYRTYTPREVPLQRLLPLRVSNRGGLKGSRLAQVNRNVLGGALRSKTLDFGGGIGMAGGMEVAFPLHAGARAIRGWVSLDRSATTGGCVRPRIYANSTSAPRLWEGPVLVGCETVADIGTIGLTGPAGGQNELVLEIDPLLQGKPAGADPLDIRDHANWYDLLLELDPAAVQAEFDRRLPERLALEDGWTVQPLSGTLAEAGLELFFERREGVPGAFEPAVHAREKPLVLRRKFTLQNDDAWLVIAAARAKTRREEVRLAVRLAGELVGEFVAADWTANPQEGRPLAVSLAGLDRTKPLTLDLEIRQEPDTRNSAVHYRAITAAKHLPTLRTVVEEGPLPTQLEAGGSAALLARDEHYYGKQSLRLPVGQYRLPLEEPVRIRERPAWGEARFLRFAVKKHGGGRVALELEDSQRRDVPARYDLGQGEPAYGDARRIGQDAWTENWIVVTRDLYADFGNIDLTGLILGCPDGDAALLDHVYLGRHPSDFDLIPAAPPAELANDKARTELAKPIIDRVTPAVVRIEFSDGRQATGVFIQAEGEILTTGHAVIGPDRDCRVMLSDGTVVEARTRGVARQYDIGVVKLAAAGKHSALEVRGHAELPQNQPYIAFTLPRLDGEFRPATSELVEVRRSLPASAWIDLEAASWLSGGPVVDRESKLVGLQIAQSQFGGVLTNRLHEAWKELPRLRNGEVWGPWPAGSEPEVGCSLEAENGEVIVRKLEESGPAANAGIRPGDILLKVGGKLVHSPDDVQRALSETDAGQEVALEIRRDGGVQEVRIKLAPRDP